MRLPLSMSGTLPRLSTVAAMRTLNVSAAFMPTPPLPLGGAKGSVAARRPPNHSFANRISSSHARSGPTWATNRPL
eukprot:954875-Prorocentrum_minimum.AAC.1